MSNLILLSVVSITLALVLYSMAVWRNWQSKRLTLGCILLLWCGLAADALATRMMGARIETIRWDLHTISGYGALALMAVLTVFGTIALVRRRESILAGFQRLAIPVWTFWVLSYATGVVLGVQRVTTG